MAKKDQGKKRVWVPKNISSVAHPTRQAIIRCLEKGPRTAVDMERELKESRYNLYHHLKTLKDEGFIKESIQGRMKVYELETDRKQAKELTEDVKNITQVQQTVTSSQSAMGGSGGADASIELEVKGSVLNKMLSKVNGQKKVAASKNYQVYVVESPAPKKKGRKKGKKK